MYWTIRESVDLLSKGKESVRGSVLAEMSALVMFMFAQRCAFFLKKTTKTIIIFKNVRLLMTIGCFFHQPVMMPVYCSATRCPAPSSFYYLSTTIRVVLIQDITSPQHVRI